VAISHRYNNGRRTILGKESIESFTVNHYKASTAIKKRPIPANDRQARG